MAKINHVLITVHEYSNIKVYKNAFYIMAEKQTTTVVDGSVLALIKEAQEFLSDK